jgi:hypothetical protein
MVPPGDGRRGLARLLLGFLLVVAWIAALDFWGGCGPFRIKQQNSLATAGELA